MIYVTHLTPPITFIDDYDTDYPDSDIYIAISKSNDKNKHPFLTFNDFVYNLDLIIVEARIMVI